MTMIKKLILKSKTPRVSCCRAARYNKVVFLFFFFLISLTAKALNAADTGWVNPSTAAEDTAQGTVSWSNYTNVYSNNTSYAIQSSLVSPNVKTYFIKATSFGLSVPAGATINGVQVQIDRKSSHNGTARYVYDEYVQLVKGNTIQGDNKAATSTKWPLADAYASYGGSSDLWGLSLSDSDVNASNFGVAISAEIINPGTTATVASVDHIQIKVYYTELVNSAPNAPSSLSPIDGSWTNDNTPTLSFTQSDPDAGDTVKYRVQVDDTSDFSSVVVDYTSALIAQGATSFTVGQAAGSGTYTVGSQGQTLADSANYYWRVMSTDNNNASSGWTTANGGAIAFKVDTTAPTNVGCNTPANAATSVSVSPTLVAKTAADANSGLHATAYYIELATDTDFTLNTQNSGWDADGSWAPGTALSNNIVYYWRVKARDAVGNESSLCGHTADSAGYGSFTTIIAAFPTVVGTQLSYTSSGLTGHIITLPANVAAGDLIIAFLAVDGTYTTSWPSPWVEIVDTQNSTEFSIAYLIASGGETSVTATTSGAERSHQAAIRISAATWHGTTAPEVATATGTSANPNSPSVTPSWGAADTLFITSFGIDAPEVAFPVTVWPTNYTGNNIESGVTPTSAAGCALATRELNATSDDPGAFTITGSDTWVSATIAVRPAAAAIGGIAVDTVTTGTGTGSSITVSHTTSGTDRLMLVGISAQGTAPVVSGVTYGGVTLSLVGSYGSGTWIAFWIYKLLAPVSQTANVVVSFSSSPNYGGVVSVMTFTGVDQNNPLGTFVSANGYGTTASVTVSSATDELVFDTMDSPSSPTVGADQTQRWNLSGYGGQYGAGSTEPGAASVTMSWTIAEQSWVIGAVPIKPTAAVTGYTSQVIIISD